MGAQIDVKKSVETAVIRTRFCELFDIELPIALGGMGSIYSTDMVAAVSEAGGLGALGCHALSAEQVSTAADAIRERTDKPFALNFLLFVVDEDAFAAALSARPQAMAFAWPHGDQDLKPYFDRSHAAGCKVTFMAGNVADARRGVDAGADVIIAQGTEGGGHVGWMASLVLTPMVVDAVAPVPVLAAGALLGTRFLASDESPLHENFKQAIVDSDGHDSLLTEIPDLARGLVWPGAMSRAVRNDFIERWAGREWEIRQRQVEIFAAVQVARKEGDTNEAPMTMGQDSGLIDDIAPAGDIVRRIANEAEDILASRLPALMK